MKRCAIFAHYDAQNEVKRYVLFHLRRLREDCDRVLFVSTSRLPEREIDKVRAYCAETWCVDNVGYDFGMWKHALSRIDVREWDELVLTNSSIFGPVAPLGPLFARMAEHPCDFWGMTGNNDMSWHIQSYFLVFKRRLLHDPAFQKFWDSVLLYRDKWQVIRSYEVGLTRFLLDWGFSPGELVSLEKLPEFFVRWRILGEQRRNLTCAYPVQLMNHGMPYVKVELLRDNPCRIRLPPVYHAVARRGYDRSLIEFDRPARPHR